VSHYSNSPNSCRVDVWKESGKWYETIQVEFADADWNKEGTQIHDAFLNALRVALQKEDGTLRLKGMRATCLEPYHQHAHPISVIIPER
jgi:hypothetical protein